MLLPREIAPTTCALHIHRGNGPLAEAGCCDEAHALHHGHACSESSSAPLRPKVAFKVAPRFSD